jgi:hypothetical protein
VDQYLQPAMNLFAWPTRRHLPEDHERFSQEELEAKGHLDGFGCGETKTEEHVRAQGMFVPGVSPFSYVV